jgi:hypothetical protein
MCVCLSLKYSSRKMFLFKGVSGFLVLLFPKSFCSYFLVSLKSGVLAHVVLFVISMEVLLLQMVESPTKFNLQVTQQQAIVKF